MSLWEEPRTRISCHRRQAPRDRHPGSSGCTDASAVGPQRWNRRASRWNTRSGFRATMRPCPARHRRDDRRRGKDVLAFHDDHCVSSDREAEHGNGNTRFRGHWPGVLMPGSPGRVAEGAAQTSSAPTTARKRPGRLAPAGVGRVRERDLRAPSERARLQSPEGARATGSAPGGTWAHRLHGPQPRSRQPPACVHPLRRLLLAGESAAGVRPGGFDGPRVRLGLVSRRHPGRGRAVGPVEDRRADRAGRRIETDPGDGR